MPLLFEITKADETSLTLLECGVKVRPSTVKLVTLTIKIVLLHNMLTAESLSLFKVE